MKSASKVQGSTTKAGQGAGRNSASSPSSPSPANGKPTVNADQSETSPTANQIPEQHAVDDLLATMKQTLSSLGSTFDSLGQQIVSVASICPRMEAARELHQTGLQLKERHAKQEERLTKLKEDLAANVKKQREEWLEDTVNRLVAEFVSKEVVRRVEYQLNMQIPSALKEEVREYKRRILRAKISLHNSEAKRINSYIQGPPAEEAILSRLLPPLADGQMTLPSPPPLFPTTVGHVFQLNEQQVISLLKVYGIEECTGIVAASPLSPGGAAREENINRLMSFIGLEYVMPSVEGNQSIKSPVFPRLSHGWSAA